MRLSLQSPLPSSCASDPFLFHCLLYVLHRGDDDKKTKKGMRVGYYQINNKGLVRYCFVPKTLLRSAQFNFDEVFTALHLKTPVSTCYRTVRTLKHYHTQPQRTLQQQPQRKTPYSNTQHTSDIQIVKLYKCWLLGR